MTTINLLGFSLIVLPVSLAFVEILSIILLLFFFVLKLIHFYSARAKIKKLKKMECKKNNFRFEMLKLEGNLSKYLIAFPLIIMVNFYYLIYSICQYIHDSVFIFQVARVISITICFSGVRELSSFVAINSLVMFLSFVVFLLLSLCKNQILWSIRQSDV